MHLSTLFVMLAPAIATVQAGCYGYSEKNGVVERWNDSVEMAKGYADQACNSGIGGYFPEGQTKYRCYQLRDRLKVEFWVRWEGRGGLTLADKDCKLRLKNEIGGCIYGGESTTAQWYFR
jgi:hypothetical protein